jgi:pimeloyl-ACP methyl ester carboxylesterase
MSPAILLAAALAASSLGGCTARAVSSPGPSMRVAGDGPVTVIFESGLGDAGDVWSAVQPSVAQDCARTVTYSRRGYGDAAAAAGPRDAERIVAELRDRLAEAGMSPPYVLVGHSLGGLYMQYFARRYPLEVAGLVLVDSTHWDQADRLRAAAPAAYSLVRAATFVSVAACDKHSRP